jgi:hypothetical protein
VEGVAGPHRVDHRDPAPRHRDRPALHLDADALRDILSEAVAAAGITCTRLGADLPTRGPDAGG